MLNKIILFATLFLINLLPLKGQQIEITPKIGIGTYSMSDLKNLLTQSVSNSPFGLKTTEKFPPYTFYVLDAVYIMSPKFGVGISTGFYSTGGRNDYADYSGSYREDILVQSINLGLLASYKGSLSSNFIYNLEVSSGIKFSNISNENYFSISDYQANSSYDFKNKSWWIEPSLRFGRRIFSNMTFYAFLGYEFNLKGKIESDDINSDELNTKIDWSGIRAGLGITYSIRLK